ncbi:LysR family transcriptional regulator [Pseudoduganella sp. RAF53_2]|uniref:LysR family transcriptional regulator n=1 Tax=unclassified Pseudoduganella TaxID=2637179 RepID=UPI003F9AA19D
MTEPNWDWYRSFLGVLDEGSLSAAARTLGLTQPTVGRHIESLEQALGLALFTRAHDGYTPTDAAQHLRPYAASLASSAAALRRMASSHGREGEVRGTVRITASEMVGAEVLPPIIADMRALHPALSVELVLSNRAGNLLQREADIAVRMFRPTQEALVARNLGTIELGFFARRDYLERHGTPASARDLDKHTLIGYESESDYIRKMRKQYPVLEGLHFSFKSDSDPALISAIRAGVGIGICQAPLAARSGLVRVLPRALSIPMETWLVMHEDLRDNPRCAAAFAALGEGLAAYVAPPTFHQAGKRA